MKTLTAPRLWITFTLVAILLSGCGTQYHADRQDEQALAAQDITNFHIRTSYGNIQLTGSETTQCHVKANIRGNAGSQERAQILADTTQIMLAKDQDRMDLYVDKPSLRPGESVGVSFTIECPQAMVVSGRTSYGNIHLENVTGAVTAESSYGNIDLQQITGPLDLETSYGNIHGQKLDVPEVEAETSFGNIYLQGNPNTYPMASDISCTSSYGDVTCRDLAAESYSIKTSFANASLECGPQTPAGVQIEVKSSYGNVNCQLPEDFTGSVNLSTSYGDIYTARGVLTQGAQKKDRLRGTIGQGTGRVECHTSFGNVHLK